jgi:hypothetical protein
VPLHSSQSGTEKSLSSGDFGPYIVHKVVIPRESTSSANAIPFIDGIAALSDAKLKDGVPITTKIRYSIYGVPGGQMPNVDLVEHGPQLHRQ